jgi:uncharacterized membrane protein HdeD (DUF308 family)
MTALAPSAQQSNVWWLFLLQGIAAILLGLMLITAPGATLIVMVTFLGFFWLIEGILSLVHVFTDRSVPWIWSLLTGIVGILAGILVVRHPLLAALTVPTVLVILLGVGGLIMGALEIGWIYRRWNWVLHSRRDQRVDRTAAARLAGGGGTGGAAGIRRAPAGGRHRADHLGI